MSMPLAVSTLAAIAAETPTALFLLRKAMILNNWEACAEMPARDGTTSLCGGSSVCGRL
jgi:hypothetical protein